MDKLTGYELSRQWFDFSFENPDMIKPIHTAIYFFACEHCNRLGGKEKFGLPSIMTMEAIGVKSHNTYIKGFNDLVKWGFIILHEKSTNQYSSNIIAISKYDKALYKALDKALIKHDTKQRESTVQSTDHITKPITINNKPINNKPIIYSFDDFWNDYDKKVGRKNCEAKWKKIKNPDKLKIKETLKNYVILNPDPVYRKNPMTYLNGEHWNDEIKENNFNKNSYEKQSEIREIRDNIGKNTPGI